MLQLTKNLNFFYKVVEYLSKYFLLLKPKIKNTYGLLLEMKFMIFDSTNHALE